MLDRTHNLTRLCSIKAEEGKLHKIEIEPSVPPSLASTAGHCNRRHVQVVVLCQQQLRTEGDVLLLYTDGLWAKGTIVNSLPLDVVGLTIFPLREATFPEMLRCFLKCCLTKRTFVEMLPNVTDNY